MQLTRTAPMKRPTVARWLPAVLLAARPLSGQICDTPVAARSAVSASGDASSGALAMASGRPATGGSVALPEFDAGASRDLYCLELLPAPGLGVASGHVELGRNPGPFSVAVDADGSPITVPIVTLAGLPVPSSLGPYSTYVAWVSPPMMYPVQKLGVVTNGRTRLGSFSVDPFVVRITAERSPDVSAPTGRIILRGGSPSTRLQPPDLLQFSVGAALDSGDQAVGMMPMTHDTLHSIGQANRTGSDSAHWTTVPMPAGLAMLPAEMALRPSVTAYLPQPSPGTRVQDGRPGTIAQLADGDTLQLVAGFVRRAIAGHVLTMYAFNGQYPGPQISVRQGSSIVVVYTNHLDQPSSVHWHGVRLDNQFDGVPGLTQEAVPVGGHFTYRVRFPDAGVFWYHPHVREDVQQALGLYGNIVVRAAATTDRGGDAPVTGEQALILGDLLVGDQGLIPFGLDASTDALMGRFGNVFLVNGAPRYTRTVRRGDVIRFAFTNASATRTYNVSFSGARMKLVGGDAGRFEREVWVSSVVIAPAERYIVDVRFERPGSVPVVNRVRALDHLFNHFFAETDTLGVISVSAGSSGSDLSRQFALLHADRAASHEIDRYRPFFDRPPDRTLELLVELHGLPFVTHQLLQLDSAYFTPVEWARTMPGMNWASTTDQVRWVLRDPATGRENMDIAWTFRRGDVIKLRLVNLRHSLHAMQHPIHLHGQRFLVLAVNGVRNDNLVWKDTVLVPAGATADLLVDLSNPGRWMLHCHIAEHLSAQMMTAFTVQ